MNIITRKIQILINQENIKEVFEKLYNWQEITFRAYNYTATHLYFLENTKEFFYLNDDFKLDLSKKSEAKPDGILNTSKQNTTYQLLSSKFKGGDIPTNILTSINSEVASTFSKERKEYFSGKRSLRTYKRNVPIPFSKTEMRNFEEIVDDKGNINYGFTLFGFQFKTFFGKDLSNNRSLFEKCLREEYSFGGSKLLLDGSKIFLLLNIQFESSEKQLDPNKIATASLEYNCPIRVNIGKKKFEIGSNTYIKKRMGIKGAIRRIQKELKYAKGGHGRNKKLQKLEDFKKMESEVVKNALHKYSKELINLCLKNNVGKLILASDSEFEKSIEAKIKELQKNDSLSYAEKQHLIEEAKITISTWSYLGLINMISYKAKIHGIEVELNK